MRPTCVLGVCHKLGSIIEMPVSIFLASALSWVLGVLSAERA
jgi:hypothetical protein